MNNLVRAMLAASLAAGCGGGTPRVQPEDAAALEREVVAWVAAWDETRAQGFAPGALSIGVGPRDARDGAAAIAAAPPAVRAAAEEADVIPALSPDGRAAWVMRPGDVRWTALLERSDGGWRALVAHASRGVPGDEARRREEEGAFPPLADLGDGVPEEARPLAQAISEALGGAEAFAAAISRRPGTAAIGPGPEDRYTGTHDVSEFVRALFSRPGSRLMRAGGMRGGLAAGGAAGWIATNVEWVVRRGVRDLARPCRMTAVLAPEDGRWAIVQLHLSHAIEETD